MAMTRPLSSQIITAPPGSDPTGVLDSYPAFAAAVAALPAFGGTIDVPAGIWRLNTTLTWGTKSIFWNISTGASFIGTGVGEGKFPYLNTNIAQLAVGPWIQSRSSQHSTNSNGGIAAFQVEMLQPSDYGVGQSVALYAGAAGANPNINGNVWAANLLIRSDVGALGSFQGLEIDVDTFAAGAARTQGLLISGLGTVDPTYGIALTRADTTRWGAGIYMDHCNAGIVLTNSLGNMSRGIDVGAPTIVGNTTFSGKQLALGGDILFGQRKSDTTLTGNFLRLVNTANSANLFSVDVSGNVGCGIINAIGDITTLGQIVATGNIAGNIVTGANLRVSVGANPVAAGTVCLGSSTAGTAGASSGQFLIIYVGGTQYKLDLRAA